MLLNFALTFSFFLSSSVILDQYIRPTVFLSIPLVISGKPINEEIARGGPFVMNTKAEILQAVQDYHNDTFVK